MEVERRTSRTERSDIEGQNHSQLSQGMHSHFTSTVRNIEIDWREVDPYFSELSDCASFWTLINFTCDVIYSGLFVLFFIMGQDVESMFFEGLLNHINPILIYLILSLTINYGALRSLRCGREKLFLVFSVMKALLFPITMSLLVYLVFFDVQEYFGTFWISFVVIVSCYNGTAALGLWSMFTCNKYILVNEAAQKRLRKQAKRQRSTNNEQLVADCRCATSAATATTLVNCDNNQNTSRPSTSATAPTSSRSLRRSHHDIIGDSSSASNIIFVYKPDSCTDSSKSNNAKKWSRSCNSSSNCQRSNESGCGTSRGLVNSVNAMSFGEDDEVLQISTVQKVMQEIRFLESTNHDQSDEDGDSL